jgi:hypothetical protein
MGMILAEIAMWTLLTIILTSGIAAIVANAFFGFPEERDDDVV